MKLPLSNTSLTPSQTASGSRFVAVKPRATYVTGFTMVEIAICLAVIGFALVAIIGVLPVGMNVQKENREDTVINFDANYLMDAIRSGSQGLDNLTNYVMSITNISILCGPDGTPLGTVYTRFYTPTNYNDGVNFHSSNPGLTNGITIIGLLSQPKYLYDPNPKDPPGSYYSNYVQADIRAISGSPMDQGFSQTSKDFAFTYRVTVEVLPSAEFPYGWVDAQKQAENFTSPGTGVLVKTNSLPPSLTNAWALANNLQANLNEIRLRFRWPVLPGGKLGNGSLVYRTSASGQDMPTNSVAWPAAPAPFGNYYLIQPQYYSATQ